LDQIESLKLENVALEKVCVCYIFKEIKILLRKEV
jgi:hypothetical protein